jgi:uncharacterized protein YndB with AHSA1/START domain
MLKKIAVVVVVIVVGILAFAATRPDSFRVVRSATIKAPPDKIYPLLADFHRWSAWSPWEKLDPAMKRTFSGAPSGKGAVYAWEGDSKVGAGRMEITDVSPPSNLAIKLDFLKPIEGHDVTLFTLEPTGEVTKVTWDMSGQSPYMSKVMGVFVSMDSLVGKDFETGLSNLRAAAEK